MGLMGLIGLIGPIGPISLIGLIGPIGPIGPIGLIRHIVPVVAHSVVYSLFIFLCFLFPMGPFGAHRACPSLAPSPSLLPSEGEGED